MKDIHYIVLLLIFIPYHEARLPLVISTWDFNNATKAAWTALTNQKQSAIDALVAGCSVCEVEQCDFTVGYGGSPDEKGDVRLDALIMDGRTMNVGAVASLKNIRNVIGVAKHVLLHTKHSILVGDAALDFAKQMGFQEQATETDLSNQIWSDWIRSRCQPNFWENVSPDPRQNCGPYTPVPPKNLDSSTENDINYNYHGEHQVYSYEYARYNHDTIGMIVIDENGHLVAGTSTNGARFKIPGRVGDSPIPGAGAYAVNDVGAAAATGDGDILLRFLPSFHAVEELRRGISPKQAATLALNRIVKYYDFMGGIVVADNKGNYGAACHGMTYFPFRVFNDDSSVVQELTVQCIN